MQRKDGSARGGWKGKGSMERQRKDGSGRELWKCKRRMMAGGASSPLKTKGALMKRRNTSRAKAEKHQSPQLQAGDLLWFEKMSTSSGLIKNY